jgi:L-histidine N-alpha-methyltransferase
MKISNLIEDHQWAGEDTFATDIHAGLSAPIKSISAKYFYDDRGSELFQKITQVEDYYLTRKEYSILNDIQSVLPRKLKLKEIDIVELGVGDGHKSRLLIDGFLEGGCQVKFYPIDISSKAMELLGTNIRDRPGLEIEGVVADYFAGLSYVSKKSKRNQLVLFLGSNIGNFDRGFSLEFLRSLRASLDKGAYALIGFDLKKDVRVLSKAYNDGEGYTEQFNLNLLRRINNELGGSFDLDSFQHHGFYNPRLGTMESYLVSLKSQDIFIDRFGKSFHFEEFEPIHLEYSFKFLESDINRLAEQSGFRIVEHFSDSDRYFIDSLWEAV